DNLQYYADVPEFESIGDIFRNYVQKAPKLTVHSGTHPPGGTLFMWLVAHLFVYDKLTTSFAIILFAPLALIPMYLLSEQFYSRKVGLYTLALYLVTPNLVMFTATSMDAVFTVFLIWSVYLCSDFDIF
ncbi:TPA: hypothetical protein EYP66_13590, partial [Candidatus Poribacteria bacterium]|nr:hypothetical protein [Candidatus Poribacteria bacterium]